MPEEICAMAFSEEICFWGIDDIYMESCCSSRYHMKKEQILDELKRETEAKEDKDGLEFQGMWCGQHRKRIGLGSGQKYIKKNILKISGKKMCEPLFPHVGSPRKTKLLNGSQDPGHSISLFHCRFNHYAYADNLARLCGTSLQT